MAQYGIINEQGDLGIFDLLNEKDNNIVNEAVARERSENHQNQNISVINENQKNK